MTLIQQRRRVSGQMRVRDSRERKLRRRAALLGLRLHRPAPAGRLARRLGPFYVTSDRMRGAVVGYALADLDAVVGFLRRFRQWQA